MRDGKCERSARKLRPVESMIQSEGLPRQLARLGCCLFSCLWKKMTFAGSKLKVSFSSEEPLRNQRRRQRPRRRIKSVNLELRRRAAAAGIRERSQLASFPCLPRLCNHQTAQQVREQFREPKRYWHSHVVFLLRNLSD